MHRLLSSTAFNCAFPIFFFCTIFNYEPARAQTGLDSLYQIVDMSNRDSLSLERALGVIRYWNTSDTKVGLLLTKRLVGVSRKNPAAKHLDISFRMLGISYGLSANYDSSIIAFDSAIVSARNLNNHREVVNNYQNKGITEDYQSKYKAAFKSYLSALAIAKEHNFDKSGIYISMARTYMHTMDYANALHYDSLAIGEASAAGADKSRMDILLENHASNLTAVKKYSAARKILVQLIRNNTEQKYFLASQYKELGEVELETRHYDAARAALLKAMELFEEAHVTGELPETYTLLARTEFAARRFSSAQSYAEKAKLLADSARAVDILPGIAKLLANIHLVNKQYERFQFYDSLHDMYSDSLNLKEQNRAVAELNIQYESEKKDKENLLLRASQLTQDGHILRQRYIIVIVALSLVATLILLLIIRKQNEVSRRNNLLLQQKNEAIGRQSTEILVQKKEIEEKNEELRLTIEEVKTMQTQLIHAEKMSSLGQMTAGIAHEINNPLNFIAGSAQALKFSHNEFINEARQCKTLDQGWVDEVSTESNSLFDALDNGVYRISKIVSSLKAFSGPQQGGVVETSIIEIVEMSLTLLNTRLRENNIEVVRDYKEPTLLLWLNPTQMTHVFTNILDNAIDAMVAVEAPRLEICAGEKSGMLVVTIKDNGAGIPYEIHSRILEPFFTTKAVGKGTGLGLSVSLGIVEKHGGRLNFGSEPGKGSIFTVELPRAKSRNEVQSGFNPEG